MMEEKQNTEKKERAMRENESPKAGDEAMSHLNLTHDLRDLLNRYSCENGSGTPDYVLCQFLLESLTAFDRATNVRSVHQNGSTKLEAHYEV